MVGRTGHLSFFWVVVGAFFLQFSVALLGL
jgi:hypothetical protein